MSADERRIGSAGSGSRAPSPGRSGDRPALELTVLGAGSILPRVGYGCAGYVLRAARSPGVTLLDCGPGSVRALAPAGVRLGEVRRVVLSHFHLDHCLDVFALFFARRNPAFEAPPLELCGPVGLRRLVEEAPRALGEWARDPRAEVCEVSLDARGRGGFEREGLAFTCAENGHNEESVSWRVDAGGTSLAYTGDTNDDPAVAELARDADLLVSECSFPDEEAAPNHLTPSSAAALAARAGARRLLLSHFYPSLDPLRARERAAELFPGPIDLARDQSVHRIA